jgi:hypothetical protein
MTCPVCGGTDRKTINVRISRDSDLKQLVGSTWDARNMARCNDCGVLYDHRYVESDGSDDGTEGSRTTPDTVNCPDCGSPNPGDRDTCEYCGARLDPSATQP